MLFASSGFLGTRATFMMDVVALAMLAFLPILAFSVWQVMYRQKYALHKKMQITLAVVLLVAVSLFEYDVRATGWREQAALSPYWGNGGGTNWVTVMLTVHLFFAVSTALIWFVVMGRALKNFASPPAPGAHSAWHRRYGMIAAFDLACTSLTGWMFYWLAFVAT